MKDEIKEKFYSLEELKRTIDCYDGYVDNEEVYYFIGALRFAYDYIINLQEELKSANESITWYSNRFKAVERDNERLKEENERLKENNKKKTSRCTERNHRIRGCQRVIERRNKKISKSEQQLDKYKNVIDKIKEIFKDYGDSENIVGYSMYNITGEDLLIIKELLEEVE